MSSLVSLSVHMVWCNAVVQCLPCSSAAGDAGVGREANGVGRQDWTDGTGSTYSTYVVRTEETVGLVERTYSVLVRSSAGTGTGTGTGAGLFERAVEGRGEGRLTKSLGWPKQASPFRIRGCQ